jgi:predicted helicase
MLLPYYIASLNIEHEYYSKTGEYEPFEGICFADTLELAEGRQLSLFVEENTERVKREKEANIMVVIGNPPYNMGQKNENDNNRNRSYTVVDKAIRETYAKSSKATNTNKLYDAYVKFFRWATDRLKGQDGVVCLVTNNSFIDQVAFDGMRMYLQKDFTQIYHIDLHGNTRKNPKISGTTHNVFGIQVGVGITIAVRSKDQTEKAVHYYRLPEFWTKVEKLKFLTDNTNISGISWQKLTPNEKNAWFTSNVDDEFSSFISIGTKEAKSLSKGIDADVRTLFNIYSLGANTNRDNWMYDFNQEKLASKVDSMIETYNAELSRWKRAGFPKDVDSFVLADETKIKWSSRLKECFVRRMEAHFNKWAIRNALYRPFTRQFLYLDKIMTHRQGLFPTILPNSDTERENIVIWLKVGSEWPMFALATNVIPDLLPQGGSQCFPYYTYAEDGTNRRENITDWALKQFQAKYGEQVTKWDIFHYVYAILHHPQYRERYAENLKRDLPHIPLVTTREIFDCCVSTGKALMKLHLNYEHEREYRLDWQENEDVPFSWRVEKMRLTPDKTSIIVNESLTLSGIPLECFLYHLGNRSALEWVLDQYQVSTDKRSGIVSDPNNLDDQEYIVRLIGKVITVSVETVKLVNALAQAVTVEDWIDGSMVTPTATKP